MASAEEGMDNFTMCCVCRDEYDNTVHQPKFLECLHTVCLDCAKRILCFKNPIICPLCQVKSFCPGGKVNLKNNPYALPMIKMKKKMNPLLSRVKTEESANLSAKEDYDQAKMNFEGALDARRKMKTYFHEILDKLEAVKFEMTLRSAKNDAKIYELRNILDQYKKAKTDQSEQSEKELDSTNRWTSTIRWENELLIKIKLETFNNQSVHSIPIFQHGFRADEAITDPKITLLSHLLFSIINEDGATLAIREEEEDETTSTDEYDRDDYDDRTDEDDYNRQLYYMMIRKM